MADLVGKTLGKYRIVAKLGRGGMAEVYKAYQPGLNRYVAIKVLYSFLVGDTNLIGRFGREALAVGKLRHSHIVQVLDFDREGDVYFMALEFIDGPTLKDELQARKTAGQPFTLKEIAQIFTALCSAIDYAHARGMVHRDLKPANVMINQEGQIVLTDFGVARMMEATTQYTRTGALTGTPAYMSPEQGQGQHGDERSDIYSLGVMLYEMVTGVVPYEADTPFAVVMKHVIEPLRLPSSLVPNLPESIERVILKALSKNPADRYQTAGELAKALREATGMRSGDEHIPLKIVSPRLQVQQFEPPADRVTVKEKTPTVIAQWGGATVLSPQQATVTTQTAPARRVPWLPLVMGGGLVLLLVLGGLVGALLISRPTPTPLLDSGGRVDEGTATVAAQLRATETAQAQATAAAQAASLTQTAQAAMVQAEAMTAKQTAEAQLIAGVLSAQAATVTAVAMEAAIATAVAQQVNATETAAAQAAEAQAAADQVATQTAAVQVTQTAAAQVTQTAAAQAAQTAEARPVIAQAAAVSGTFNDFEIASTWRRGDEANGTFERSTAQSYEGDYAGQLNYNFPSVENDYVVFLWPQTLGGQPNQITTWVYGDGLGHFLNLWVEDSAGETWQFSFGQVKHTGWQQMSAPLAPGQPWPAGHISGPDNGQVDYPISFQALVLDDGSDDYRGSGTIYIDSLASATATRPPTPVASPAPPFSFRADRTTLRAGECATLSWDIENVSAIYFEGEGAPGHGSRQVCPTATTTYTLHVVLKDGASVNQTVVIAVQ